MVKRSRVLVAFTHVTGGLKCVSLVWAAWLVPITSCSNQSVQTAVTTGSKLLCAVSDGEGGEWWGEKNRNDNGDKITLLMPPPKLPP